MLTINLCNIGNIYYDLSINLHLTVEFGVLYPYKVPVLVIVCTQIINPGEPNISVNGQGHNAMHTNITISSNFVSYGQILLCMQI